jgi:hypothetical protein
MKGITAFALNNSRTVIMTILLVIVGGLYAFMKLFRNWKTHSLRFAKRWWWQGIPACRWSRSNA